jgi:hypothetical protein
MKRCDNCGRMLTRSPEGRAYDPRHECNRPDSDECKDVGWHYRRGMIAAASFAGSALAELGGILLRRRPR